MWLTVSYACTLNCCPPCLRNRSNRVVIIAESTRNTVRAPASVFGGVKSPCLVGFHLTVMVPLIRNVNRDAGSTRMIRTTPSTKPAFGQDCVVRVMDAAKAVSADEFVRGIVFNGFIRDRGTGRRQQVRDQGRTVSMQTMVWR